MLTKSFVSGENHVATDKCYQPQPTEDSLYAR